MTTTVKRSVPTEVVVSRHGALSQYVLAILLFFVFISPTVQMRIELGAFSIALLEPIVISISGLLILNQLATKGRIAISTNPILLPVIALMLWAILVRPWAGQMTRGLSDVRDWIVPLVGMVALLGSIRHNWRLWTCLIILIGTIWAGLGIYQYFTNTVGPFVIDDAIWKTNFNVVGDTLEQSHFASALFAHPNAMGEFLSIAVLLCIGWFLSSSRGRLLKGVVLMILALGLYLSFAKAALVITISFSILLLVNHVVSRFYDFLFLVISVATTLLVVGVFLYFTLPEALFVTLNWRFELWNATTEVIKLHPEVLLFGSGLEHFAEVGFYTQPHNNYIFALLEYGIIGFLLVVMLFLLIVRQGLRARARGLMKDEPLLAALWFALLSYIVFSFIQTMFESIELRMVFVILLTCFIGLERGLRWQSVNTLTYRSAEAGTTSDA